MMGLGLHRLFIVLTLWQSSQANLGYFWQITDLHLDLNYSSGGNRDRMCWGKNGGGAYRTGHFGDYSCDSPFSLVKSAIKAMKRVTGDHWNGLEFILWTGDSVSHATHGSDEHFSHSTLFHIMHNVTSLFRQEFTGAAIYPVLGIMDWWPRYSMSPGHDGFHERLKKYGQMWSNWIPPESLEDFYKGGYYAIERRNQRLSLLILNTSLWFKRNRGLGPTEQDPADQFKWLENMLAKARRRSQTVYLVGHIAPGKMDRYMSSRMGYHVYQEDFNKRYLKMVREYYDVIVGQFFGHFHSDSFRVIYKKFDEGKFLDRTPISYIFLAPSVSPRRSEVNDVGPNNPGLRLYRFNTSSGQIFDYSQYYLNLTEANEKNRSDWRVLYNLTSYYHLPNVTASSLNELAFSFMNNSEGSKELFRRYYAANSVGYEHPRSCTLLCRRTHFCVIINLDYQDYERCIQTVLSDFNGASSVVGQVTFPSTFNLILFLLPIMWGIP